MAFCAHDCFYLVVGREIKKTLNAGRRGDFARNGTGLAMLYLSNGEADTFVCESTLDQKNRCMKHIVVEEESIQIVQVGQLNIALYVPQQYTGGGAQFLVILHQQLHIPLQQCLYMVWVFIVDDVVAHRPKNCAIGAGLRIGKGRLWVVTRVGVAFSLTPFLDGQPVACWTIEDVIAIGQSGGYAVIANGRAEKIAKSVLFSLQFHQQLAGLVGCQGGRSVNNGNATPHTTGPAVKASFEAVNGIPEIKELGYGIAIEVRGVAKIEQVSFFVVGWATDGSAFGAGVDRFIVGRQKAGFGVGGVFYVAFYRKSFFSTAAFRAGRVLYFFAVGGCRKCVAIVAANDVVAHFFQFCFVGNIFQGVENCLYANDTLIGVVERQVKCIWTQILSPLYRFILAEILEKVKFWDKYRRKRTKEKYMAGRETNASVSRPFGGEVVIRREPQASITKGIQNKFIRKQCRTKK